MTYKYEYFFGKGAGDLYIQANCGIIFSEIYVEDLLLYRSSVSAGETFDIELPSHFEMTATVTKTSSSTAYAYFRVNNYDCGSLTQNGRLFIRKIGNVILASTNDEVIQLNQPTILKYEYNNGTHTVSANGRSITGTDALTTGNFIQLYLQNYVARELKVKPL